MIEQFGFSPEDRVFKNSATTNPTSSTIKVEHNHIFDVEGNPIDIGHVSLFEFLVKFGQSMDILPENIEQILDFQSEESFENIIEKVNNKHTTNNKYSEL